MCGNGAIQEISTGGHVVCHFLSGIRDRVWGIFCSEQGPAKNTWELVPLTPEYLAKEHGVLGGECSNHSIQTI